MGPIGIQEMIAIFVIALVLFGPKKLPELGRTLGKAITEFRRASNELKATFESHLHELEREGQTIKESLNTYIEPAPSTYSYSHDDYSHYDADYHQYSGSTGTSEAQPSTASATAVEDAHQNANIAHDSHLPETVPYTGSHSADQVAKPEGGSDEVHPA
jgi:sec-independent protein translocase protein TatA